jgi:hypothetical protein
MRRNLLVIIALALATTGLTAPVAAQEEATYPLIFPVVGEYSYTDSWGAPRSGDRTHEGVDIMSTKMVPIVAAADGTVGWIHDTVGDGCCSMALNHDDGWTSWYVHLNNDTPGTDDGLGFGFADGIESGVHVRAGRLIGWVGDSGNAEACDCPHLHFELQQPDGTKVNPYPHLMAATPIADPLAADFLPPFWDDDGSAHEGNIIFIFERGITLGCSPGQYCPSDPVVREHMAAFIQRALDLPDGPEDWFTDDDDSPFQNAINAIATADVTSGCADGSFCPDDFVTRGQMASFLVRAFAVPATELDGFADDDGSTHEAAIDALAAAGITAGCATEGSFCPDDFVTRAQMASFLARAIVWAEAQPAG